MANRQSPMNALARAASALIALTGSSALADLPQEIYLKSDQPRGNGYFGQELQADGSRVVVPVRSEDAAYVYSVSRSGLWSRESRLRPDDGGDYGRSAAIDGDTIIIGSPPRAYLYQRDADGRWPRIATLTSPTDGDGLFGWSVALDGDLLVIGDPEDDGGGRGINGVSDARSSNSGAVHVYRRQGDTFIFEASIKTSNSDPGDRFGEKVALDGDAMVASAPGENSQSTGINGNQNDNSGDDIGAAYIFRHVGNWRQEAYLKGGTGEEPRGSEFSSAIAIEGDTVVTGDSKNNKVWTYKRRNSVWGAERSLAGFDTKPGDNFGHSVALEGGQLLVGAYKADDPDGEPRNGGSAYLFTDRDTSWAQTCVLRASNADEDDSFGWSVTLSERFAVVGAIEERSGKAGISPAQNDDGTRGAGAVYIFGRGESDTSPSNNDDQLLLRESVDVGGGWRWNAWLNFFYRFDERWVYVLDRGAWWYLEGGSDNLNFYDSSRGHWLFTAENTYPFAYDYNAVGWINFAE